MEKKKFLTSKDTFIMIEVAEELVEFVKESNQEVWRNTKQDSRIIVISLDFLSEKNAIEFAGNIRNPEEEMMYEIRDKMKRELINLLFMILSEKEQELIILRFYNGLKISEIAEKENCVKAAVSQHLKRIYKKLRKAFKEVDIKELFMD